MPGVDVEGGGRWYSGRLLALIVLLFPLGFFNFVLFVFIPTRSRWRDAPQSIIALLLLVGLLRPHELHKIDAVALEEAVEAALATAGHSQLGVLRWPLHQLSVLPRELSEYWLAFC